MEVEEDSSKPKSGLEMEAKLEEEALAELRRVDTLIVDVPTLIVSPIPIFLVE